VALADREAIIFPAEEAERGKSVESGFGRDLLIYPSARGNGPVVIALEKKSLGLY
jgi:hypothetical protein